MRLIEVAPLLRFFSSFVSFGRLCVFMDITVSVVFSCYVFENTPDIVAIKEFGIFGR